MQVYCISASADVYITLQQHVLCCVHVCGLAQRTWPLCYNTLNKYLPNQVRQLAFLLCGAMSSCLNSFLIVVSMV